MIDARTLADIRVNVAIQAELIRIQGMLAAIIDRARRVYTCIIRTADKRAGQKRNFRG
jgi:hypothetical protein